MSPLRAAAKVWAGHTGAAHEYDCCVFVQAVLTELYDLPPASPANMALWRIHRDSNGSVPESRVWGPVTVAGRLGLLSARSSPGALVPDAVGWYICQGWRNYAGSGPLTAPPARGHTWLWRVWEKDLGTVLESSYPEGVRVQFEHWSVRRVRYDHVMCGLLRAPTTLAPT
jgi:hypothetical protein